MSNYRIVKLTCGKLSSILAWKMEDLTQIGDYLAPGYEMRLMGQWLILVSPRGEEIGGRLDGMPEMREAKRRSVMERWLGYDHSRRRRL